MIDEEKRKQEPQQNSNTITESGAKPLLVSAGGDAIDKPVTANHADDHRQKPQNFVWKRITSWWRRIRNKDAKFWQAVFSGLAVAILIAYTWYTRQQWITLDKSVTDNEKQFRETLCQMKAQTANMKELADSAWLEAKGTRAALVVFSYRIDTEELTLSADNGGPSKAENVTAHIVLTRRTWPDKKLVGASLSFTVPPQLVNQLGFIWGNRLEKKFSLEGISKKDWDAILQGEQFITVELGGSYDNGFREKIEPPKICESLIWLSPLKWKNNQSGGGPLPETCGRTFDTEMAVTMKQRKEMQEQIRKEGK
jgi:hypothetical protein